jgi:hypothetical protein
LQIQRAIAKRRTTLNTLATAVAQILIDGVLEVGVFDKLASYGTRGAHHILGSGIQILDI